MVMRPPSVRFNCILGAEKTVGLSFLDLSSVLCSDVSILCAIAVPLSEMFFRATILPAKYIWLPCVTFDD